MIVENSDGVAPAVARALQIVAFAMGGGLTMMACVVFWAYVHAAAKVPTPSEMRTVSVLTAVLLVAAAGAIVASEVIWRALLRRSAGTFSSAVQTAFIARLACREGAGMLGLAAAFIAAQSGVLRLTPAYWVSLAPFVLFLSFLAAHWPSAENLEAEARGILGGGPASIRK